MRARANLDPAAIERDLRAMWRAAGAESPEQPVVRAALANFVMLSSPGDDTSVAETVARVSEALPCRALVVQRLGPRADTPPFEAVTSMHCRAWGRGPQVCCEQVTLRVRTQAREALPAAILGLLLPDVPTILYVPGGAELDEALLDRLAKHLERLVVDSAGFASPESDLAALEAWRNRGLEIADLNWARLDVWRELFASFFDAPPFDRDLETLDRLEIDHDPGARARALLLAGWLASRLGWEFVPGGEPAGGRRGTGRGAFLRGAAPIEIRITEASSAASPAGLQRLSACTASGTRYRVERDPVHPTLLVARIETAGKCPLPQRTERLVFDTDTELVRLLERAPGNPAHAEALAAVPRVAAASGAA